MNTCGECGNKSYVLYATKDKRIWLCPECEDKDRIKDEVQKVD